jgi:hypothetical protein
MIAMMPPEDRKAYRDLFKDAMIKASSSMGIQIKDIDLTVKKIWHSVWNRHMQAWLIYRKGIVIGLVLTKVIRDDFLDYNELLVYCLYIIEGFSMSLEEWDQCYNKLSEFGYEMGCRWITAYTTVERVRRMASRMGGTINTTYIRVPIQRSKP